MKLTTARNPLFAAYIWARCWNIWICNTVMQCVWRGPHMVDRRLPYLGCEVGGWWFRATTTSIMSSQRTLRASFPWTAYCHLRLQTTALPPPLTRFGCAPPDRRKGGNTSASGKGWGSGTELNYLSICHSLYGFTDTPTPFQYLLM